MTSKERYLLSDTRKAFIKRYAERKRILDRERKKRLRATDTIWRDKERARDKKRSKESLKRKISMQRYYKSEKCREKDRRRNKTIKRKAWIRNYSKSERGVAARRKFRLSGKGKLWAKNGQYKAKYGLSVEDVERMIKKQNGLCNCCFNKLDDLLTTTYSGKTWFTPNVDHDHSTGKVRGILCARCNIMIGFANDNSATLRNAADYLDKHSIKRTPKF